MTQKIDLHSTIDASVWASEFCKLNTAADEGAMLGWFANALMTGFDEANRRANMPGACAVSPAESVQRHEKLFQLIHDWRRAITAHDLKFIGESAQKVIAYIDAEIAAAHAEGRRSAMEELAKEKERADRAEAQLTSATDEGYLRGAQEQSEKDDCLLEDLKRRLEAAELEAKSDRAAFFAALRLLSSTAQPLQQEGGYTLAPRIPTEAMCIAAREKLQIGANYAGHVYQTMLAAAPPPFALSLSL